MKVVVIGAGVIGLGSALELRRAGHEVSVVDKGAAGAGTSTRNAGWIVPSMSTPVPAPGMMLQAVKWMARPDGPLYLSPGRDARFLSFCLAMLRYCRADRFSHGLLVFAQLNRDTLALYDQWKASGVMFEEHRVPFTMLFETEKDFAGHAQELKSMEGLLEDFAWASVGRDELRQRLPSLSPKIIAGLQTAGDRSVDPRSLVAGLEAACRAEGVACLWEAQVALQRSGDRVDVTVGGRALPADHVVVAAGVWSNDLLSTVNEQIPLQAGKGHGYDLPPDPTGPQTPIYLAEARVAITPLKTHTRLAGTMGIGAINLRVQQRRAAGILSAVRASFPGWRALQAAPAPWAGLRPMTPDGLPVVGRARHSRNLTIATGHAMLGVTLAPVTARRVAAIVAGAADDHLTSSLSATRFA